jgi:transcriptional regulator with XRE-family HTH domain
MLTDTADAGDMSAAAAREHHDAHEWRKAMKLSRRELAELTGYSERAIQNFEQGKRHDGAPITAESMRAYKVACGFLTAGLSFDWRSVRCTWGDVEIRRTLR